MHRQSSAAGAAVVAEDATSPPPQPVGLAPAQPRRSERLDSLTGLRFIAAFFILFAHSCDWLGQFKDGDPTSILRVVAIYGMPLFFVLSGFVIHYNYGKLFATMRFRWAAAQFLGARIARLYPLMVACFAVGLIVDRTFDWLQSHPQWWCHLVLSYLTMTQSWTYVIIFGDRLLMLNAFGLSWSISTEFFFYIAYLGLVFLILPMRTPRTTVISWIIFASVALFFFSECYAYKEEIEDLARQNLVNFVTIQKRFDTSFLRWLFYYSPYSCIAEFIIGCLTAHLYLQLQDRPVSPQEQKYATIALWSALFVLAVIGFFYVSDEPLPAFHEYVWFLALNFACVAPIGILIFCVARYENPVSDFLCHPQMVLLGEMSYSIYAIHTWTLRIFEHDRAVLSPIEVADTACRIVLGIAVTLVLSTATYRLIELPARQRLRGVFGRLTVATMGEQAANRRAPRLPAGREASVAILSLLALAGVMVVFVLWQ